MTPLANIANLLTLLRLICVPVVVALLFSGGGQEGSTRYWAAAVFVAASLTDLMDGAVARRHGLVTSLGTIADPIADKALTGATLVSLSLLGDLAWWITGVIILREIGVTILRLTGLNYGVIPASRGGKLKTVIQVVAITMYLLEFQQLSWWSTASALMMLIAVALTVVTGVEYFVRAWPLRSGHASR